MGRGNRPATVGAAMLALFVLALTLRYSTFVAGGADSYGYVSQAELWAKGQLRVKQPLADLVPWPAAIDTLSPLGYTPAGRDTIVPTYSAGLPLMMVAFRKVFGPAGQFYVVPAMSALLVWLSFLLARRLTGRSSIAVASALGMAASPPFLNMAMTPMSDVPAAAAWTLAVLLALSPSAPAAFCSGLAASLAVLVRPNLLPVAAVIGLAIVWHSTTAHRPTAGQRQTLARRFLPAALFGCGLLPGVVAVAAINRVLYGSPLSSGYGSLRELYSVAHVAPNARNYISWLTQNGCVPVLVGMAALVLWPRPIRAQHRGATRFLIAGVVAVVWAAYLFYLVFDVWSYLRFLLPVFPLTIVLAAALAADGLGRLRIARPGRVLTIAFTLLFVIGLSMAYRRDVFTQWLGESRYVEAGNYVTRHTPGGSVVFAMQQSGSLRYYAGRATVRYDRIDPGWLDRAVEVLMSMGMHPYIVLEDWERPEFRRRFRAASKLGGLDWPSVEIAPGVRLWDGAPAWFVEGRDRPF